MKNNLISFCVSILISLSILCICVLFDKSFSLLMMHKMNFFHL
ncbi:Uncharacterised protein [Aggregatibacter aphrophilus]|uniref:Uncharacterized protein n=1 Tax=Aggregatibacter aphrophilus TaxID=732 RepID=A0A336NG54_AGGAP|nr:Uncharacterised protein [Aggregatibacter aphrophilus]